MVTTAVHSGSSRRGYRVDDDARSGGSSSSSSAGSTTTRRSTGAGSPTPSSTSTKDRDGTARVTTRTASGNAVLRDSTTARTSAPTTSSAFAARAMMSADPRAAQLRARTDLALAARGGPGVLPTPGTHPTTPEGFKQNRDGTYTFNGTASDNDYTVRQGKDGSLTVENEDTGKEYTLPADQARKGVTINAGNGDDVVTVDKSVRMRLTIDGSSGNDVIDGSKARGKLTLRGGAGDDVLTGGSGEDSISGGGGTDIIRGGDGKDTLVGGSGDDTINGGNGDDQLLGQEGDDHLDGNAGQDYLQGGEGADAINGGTGGDAIYGDAEDTVNAGSIRKGPHATPDSGVDLIVLEQGAPAPRNLGPNDAVVRYDPKEVNAWMKDHPEVVVSGDADFRARTRADLGAMLATEQGRGLLGDLTAAVAAKGETLNIAEKLGGPGGAYSFEGNQVTVGDYAALYGDGTNRMPLPSLFHELVHAYQEHVSGLVKGHSEWADGKTTRNLEREATGLSWIDEDGNLHPANELPYTDNRFRAELGMPERTTYGGETGDPTGYIVKKDAPDDQDEEY